MNISSFGRRWFSLPGASEANAILFALIPTLAGGGIQFPATQVPSADPNTLDDYEEGTWTPTLAFGGASVGITYGGTTAGNYIKIGKLVFVDFRLTLTSKGSSVGDATIGGLPFAPGNGNGNGSTNFYSGFTGLASAPFVKPQLTSVLNVREFSATASVNVADTKFTNTSDMIFGVTYSV